jgi:uncharacterized iron-regulated protein
MTRSSFTALLASLFSAWLAACSLLLAQPQPLMPQQIDALMGAEVLLLGEQHDAPDHQRIERELVSALIARGKLSALALEMAPQGGSTTGLSRDASEDVVRSALQWVEKDWPWATYGPVAMIAVRAGVLVLGANLPSAQRGTMREQRELDMLLPGPALKAQQQNIRIGHCDALPESQITPMTRIQIARDRSMVQTLMQAREKTRAGELVLLLAGAQHVDRSQGVPLHLPADVRTMAIGMVPAEELASERIKRKFDVLWPATPAPETDHCAQFKAGTQ